jgi:DNA-binding IclR family transcriptional regulator
MIGEAVVTEQKVIKSVGRVLDLVEYFDEVRRPVSVMEVSRALDMPQSSASALLRSLVARGYCKVDDAARRYLPTARVSILGSWIDAPIFESGAILRLLNDLQARTGEAVLLASLTGMQVRLIYALASPIPGRPQKRAGTLRALGRSGLANLFLATFSDRQIGGLVRRINAEEPNRSFHVRLGALMTEIAIIRKQGYSVAMDRLEVGVGGVNVLLPPLKDVEPMAVAISTHSPIIVERHGEFFALIRDAVRQHLGRELPPVLDLTQAGTRKDALSWSGSRPGGGAGRCRS